MNNITISEYGYIGCDNIAATNNKFISYRNLTKSEFKELYDFWLSDKSAQKVFENYVEYVLKNSKDNLHIKDVLVNGGKNEYFLSNSQARLQPDYLLHMQDDSYIVTDAKWKLYDDEQKLNSNDIYQIFAYLNFYDCGDTTYLFVPKITENMLKDDKIYHYKTIANDLKYKIKIVSIDLERIIKDNHIFDINILKDNP